MDIRRDGAPELFITNPDISKSAIKQEGVNASKKTLGIHELPSGGHEGHLKHIKEKAIMWEIRMTNGHLPHKMARVANRHQLWPGLRYWLGTMTNDIKKAENILHETGYKMLNILGVACTVTSGLRKLHFIFFAVLVNLAFQRNN
jgi:hypothetical protein